MTARDKKAGKLAAVEQVARTAAFARTELGKTIRIAHSAGASLRAIAEAAGISHEQVRRIVSR